MRSFKRGGFTIVELLATMAILAVIVTVIFGITQQTANAWKSTSSKIDSFQASRAAFESITQSLSQATLNRLVKLPSPDWNGVTRACRSPSIFSDSSLVINTLLPVTNVPRLLNAR